MRYRNNGFTFIELLFVVSSVGILAAIAIPAYLDYTVKTHFSEGWSLAVTVQDAVAEFYDHTGRFPKNNNEAGLPEAETIVGRCVKSILLKDGVIYINMNIHDKSYTVWLRPAIITDNPTGPLCWVCMEGKVPEGMHVVGTPDPDLFGNRPERKFLAPHCR
jgi:type IV pilus assembly protein PilA